MKIGYRSRLLIGMLACVVLNCAAAAASGPESATLPADFPLAYYQQARKSGQEILGVDAARSLLVIVVRRTGWFASLGHDHVVASHDMVGYADMAAGTADLYVPLAQLVVDETELRTKAGFNTQPSQQDIAGTRRNMLEQTLDAGHFPYALIHVARTNGERNKLQVSITLHGTTRSYVVPAQILTTADGITVEGTMSLRQSDFGITPLSVLGGAIQVQDQLELRFSVVARAN